MTATTDLIERIRSVARAHGWAIGVHGSLKRDIDLIAAPWTVDACDWVNLWLAICKEVPLDRGGMGAKPHGRMSCILLQPGSEQLPGDPLHANFNPPQVDISFLARCPCQLNQQVPP